MKQHFLPNINILKGNHCILYCQKLGLILENKVFQNWSYWKIVLLKNSFNKKYVPRLLFLIKEKIRQIQMSLDVENLRWKSVFTKGNIWVCKFLAKNIAF